MCLVAVATQVSARYPLALAANRDELHQRPTEPAGWWTDSPGILGGRDAVAGGTWLAVDRRGRLAAVTNVREKPAHPSPHSRGWLVRDFLSGESAAEEFAASLEPRGMHFSPFNLLLIDSLGPRYVSNRAPGALLGPGVHALSNAPLGAAWPKVELARRGMRSALSQDDPVDALFGLLAMRDAGGDGDRYTRALFIEGADYGTRSSTVILASADGQITFVERRFDEHANLSGESRYTFDSGHRG